MQHRLAKLILATDIAWIVCALAVSYALRFWYWRGHTPPVPGDYALLGVVAALAWMAIFRSMHLDGFRGGWQWSAAVSRIVTAVALLLALLLAAAYLFQVAYSRLLLAGFGLLLTAGFVGIRALALHWSLRRHHQGASRRVVILGNDHTARELAQRIRRHPEMLYELVGFAHPFGSGASALPVASGAESKPMGTLALLEAFARERVQEVILLVQDLPQRELRDFLDACLAMGINVRTAPHAYELFAFRPVLSEIGGIPLLSSAGGPAIIPGLKRVIDLSVVALTAPFWLFSAAVALAAGTCAGLHPLVVAEVRCGRSGRPFRMWRVNIGDGSNSSLERFLIRSSLRDVPQIWNVLCGDMSLVGPRPEEPERAKHYSPWEARRLRVLPGLTGLAQVHGLRELHPTHDKARYDLQYLAEWTPLLDLALMIQTPLVLAARLLRRPAAAAPSAGAAPGPAPAATVCHADRS